MHETAIAYLMNTDFGSRRQVVTAWIMAIVSMAFGIYAWWAWSWSFVWVIGGIVSILLCIFNPFIWAQRKLRGMIKRPSN